MVEIPNHDVIKLNITLTASNTGELLYKTFKTQASTDDLSSENKLRLIKELEFSLANSIAQVCSSLFTLQPDDADKNEYPSSYNIFLPTIKTKPLKEIVLGASLIGNLTIAHAGEIVAKNVNDEWRHANSFINKVIHS